MSIPLELLTMGASALSTGILTIWSQSLKAKQQAHVALIERGNLQNEIFSRAREFKGTKSFQFTKRLIALSCVGAIIIMPKVLPIFGIETTIGWTQIESGFWFWSDDETKVVWHTVKGLALTPLDTHVVSSIIGMYFGASVVKNA